MDELGARRARREPPATEASPEQDLTERDREAQRQDPVADARDDQAKTADRDADARDRAAAERDATADAWDDHPSSTGPLSGGERQRARQDRANAAVDRQRSGDDRGRARSDRKTAKQGRNRAADDRDAAWDAVAKLRQLLTEAEDNAEDMLVIGQAQGQIMTARDLDPADALIELCARAARDQTSLGKASRSIVDEASPRPPALRRPGDGAHKAP